MKIKAGEKDQFLHLVKIKKKKKQTQNSHWALILFTELNHVIKVILSRTKTSQPNWSPSF